MKRHASEQDLNDVYCCAMHPPPGAKRDLDGQLEGRVLSGASEIRIGSTQSTRKVTNLLEGGSSPAVRLRAGEPDPEDVAALVAAELNSLSLEQRKEIYDDLHGVTMHREVETPETIDRWLREFKDAIRKIRYKPEYEKAAFLNPDFVLDPKIALMFLRAEDYNAKRAARRIVTHYKHKMELFGVDKLARPITFDDLDEDDKNAALTGFYQRFHLPDQSGRSVIISFPHLLNFKTAINQIRALWYFLMSAVQDDEQAQINGFVSVAYCAGFEPNILPKARLELGLESATLIEGIPFKIRGFHFCYDSPLLRPILAMMQMTVGYDIRVRTRTHYGSHQECKYGLMTFGIPVPLLPLQDDGQMNMDGFDQMMMTLRQQEVERIAREKEKEARGIVLFPKSNDVLLGRGRPYQDFPGNLRLAGLVEELRSKYKALSKRDKPAYTEEMVRIIKGQYHGRFLKKASNVETSNSPDSANGYEEGVEFHWIEVDDEVAKDKVGHSFRTTPKKKPVTASTVFFHGEASPDVWLTEVDNDLELRYTLGQSMEGGLTLNGKRAKTCTDDSKESNTDGISQEFYDKLFGGFT